jgi:Domain of unknown function (DUF1707)
MSDPSTPEPSVSPASVPALRASDAEREHVVDVLRQAAGDGRLDVQELDERLTLAYSSKTKPELEALTADVVVPVPAGAAAPATSAANTAANGAANGVVVRPGPGGTRNVISVMSGHDLTGRWRVAPTCRVVNIMGGSDLDLNDAELSDAVTTITVLSIMGGAEIHVPESADVQVSKVGIMGGNDVELSDRPPPAGAPVIRIRLISIMAGASVRQGRKQTRAERRREKELRRAQRRGELGE